MKKSLKERQLEVLKTNTVKWNRYMRFCFSINFLFSVNLSWSNLKGSNLSWSNLEGSNLKGSNLSWSNLEGSNLSWSNLSWSNLEGSNLEGSNLKGSNLSWSNLKGSNLEGSNLKGSNLDMSCLSLSCKSLKFKSDLKIRTQIGFHFASLIANAEQENVTKEEKEIYAKMLDYVNRFHRIDVAKLAKLQ